MVKRMATTSRTSIAPALLKEDQLRFQRKIQALIKWHDIPKDLVLNFDQTPSSYITVGKNTLEFEGAKSVPVKGKGKGKQIAGTFAVSAAGRFLPMQLIYAGKTKRCYPKVSSFHLVLMLPTHLIIGVTKSWPFNISVRLYFHMWIR